MKLLYTRVLFLRKHTNRQFLQHTIVLPQVITLQQESAMTWYVAYNCVYIS